MIREQLGAGAANALILLEELYWRPIISVQSAAKVTRRTYANANRLVRRFEELGLLKEITGRKRNRRYSYEHYLELFENLTDTPTKSAIKA